MHTTANKTTMDVDKAAVGVDQYRQLCFEIAESMVTSEVRDDLQRAKTFVKGDIGDVRYRKIKTPYELLDALEEVKLIREGDVEYLRVLMDAIERNDLELEVKRYMETSDVMRKKSAWPSLREGLFIGREVTINKIIHSINSGPHIKMVCVSGFPGMGKTRLSREVCLRIGLQRPNPFNTYFVELRGLMHIESIFFAIASKLGLNTKDYDPHVLYNYIREYEQGPAVIVLDSVDRPLAPGSPSAPNICLEPFLEMLDTFNRIENPLVKFIITTRSNLSHTEMKSCDAVQIVTLEEDDLTSDEAIQIIRYHAGRVEIDDDDAHKLARSCGKCPLALKVIARRLQDPELGISVSEMVQALSERFGKLSKTMKTLCHFGLARDERIDICLMDTFDQLPEPEKKNITMLSVIPGTFTIEAAKAILGHRKKQLFDTKCELRNLKSRNLLESDDIREGVDPKYLRSNLHLLLRTFIHEIKAEQQKEVRDWCEQAKKRFVRYYMDEMGDISKRFDEDHTDAMRQKENDRVNFLYLIELLKQRSGVEEDVQNVRGMERVLRLLVSAKERRSYYRKRADASKQEGNTRMYAEMRCREVVQLVQMGHKVTTLMPALNEARDILEHLPDIESSNVQISLATCYQCKGDVYYERMHYSKAEKWMLKALKLRQTYLGNHYSTINSLASLAATNLGLAFKDIEEVLPTGEVTQKCEFLSSKVYRALGFAEQALSIAGTKKHLDVPDIILNMASGYLYLEKHSKAIELYEEALKLERELQTGGFEATQVLLKNIAMCHFEMKRYDDAIIYAKRAMHNRKQLLGTHPNTARSIFFVGNIYLNMKKYDVARTHMVEALNMEECLVKSGKSLSADWVNLKTSLPNVCLVLGRNRERSEYFRRFQEIEKMKDENLPPVEEKNSSDEKFSNSDDEEQSTESIEGSNYSEQSKNAKSSSEVQLVNKQRDEELPHGEDSLRKEVVKSLLRNPSQSSTETSDEEIIFEDEHEEPLLPRPHTRSRLLLSRIICCQRLCSCCRYLTRRPRSFKKDDFDNWFPIEPMDTD